MRSSLPDNNIFLVGLMGAGKTTVGKVIAKHLQKEFIDSDQEIERRTGVRIAVIFEIEGEAGFRQRESAVLAELVTMNNIVLATGGGIILSECNRELLAKHGTVVYLNASVPDLWQRTRHDKNRPLLQTSNPQAKLNQLFAERDPFYRSIADIIIDTSKQSVQTLVQRLEQKLVENPNPSSS